MKDFHTVTVSEDELLAYRKVQSLLRQERLSNADPESDELLIQLPTGTSTSGKQEATHYFGHVHSAEGECLRRYRGPRCGVLAEGTRNLDEIREELERTANKKGWREVIAEVREGEAARVAKQNEESPK